MVKQFKCSYCGKQNKQAYKGSCGPDCSGPGGNQQMFEIIQSATSDEHEVEPFVLIIRGKDLPEKLVYDKYVDVEQGGLVPLIAKAVLAFVQEKEPLVQEKDLFVEVLTRLNEWTYIRCGWV